MQLNAEPFPHPVGSLEEVLVLGCRLQREVAASYRRLAVTMHGRGDDRLARLFVSLAELKDRHVAQAEQLGRDLLGRMPAMAGPPDGAWDGRDDEEDAAGAASLTPYRALALAVRNEDRIFAFHTYVAAHAEDAALQALAEGFATQALDHGVTLRLQRRQAFHLERPQTPALPESVAALHAIAAELDDRATRLHKLLADRLTAGGETWAAGLFRQLADEERRSATAPAIGAEPGPVTIADGIRILEHAFERYADMAARAEEEAIVRTAQELAERSLKRLSLACRARELVSGSLQA